MLHQKYCETILGDTLDSISKLGYDMAQSIVMGVVRNDRAYVSEKLYVNYSKDTLTWKKIKNSLGRKMKEFGNEYARELQRSEDIIMHYDIHPQFSRGVLHGSWSWRFFGNDMKQSRFRIYVNTHVDQLSHFVRRFIATVHKTDFLCPVCNHLKVNINDSIRKKNSGIQCGNCGSPVSLFNFKTHRATRSGHRVQEIFRHDKVIMYFSSLDTMKLVAHILGEMPQRYFASKTQMYTHELFPGVGISLNTADAENKDVARINNAEKVVFSAGEYLTSKIAEHMMIVYRRLIYSEHKLLELLHKTIKSRKEHEQLHVLLLRFLHSHEREVVASLSADASFREWTHRMSELTSEISNI